MVSPFMLLHHIVGLERKLAMIFKPLYNLHMESAHGKTCNMRMIIDIIFSNFYRVICSINSKYNIVFLGFVGELTIRWLVKPQLQQKQHEPSLLLIWILGVVLEHELKGNIKLSHKYFICFNFLNKYNKHS